MEYALVLGGLALALVAGLQGFNDNVGSELDERGEHIGAPDDELSTMASFTTTTLPPATTVSGPSTTVVLGTVHLETLSATSSWASSKWVATVEITVHDGNENPVGGALVEGTWSEPVLSDNACTTGVDGTCTMTQWNLQSSRAATSWAIASITATGMIYQPADNTVNSIVVPRPA